MPRSTMLVRVRTDDTSTTKQDLIDEAVGDHRIADGLGSIWQDPADLSVLVVRLWVDGDTLDEAKQEAQRIVAGALLEAGETVATTTIEEVLPDTRSPRA